MVRFALNHMTVPGLRYEAVLDLAAAQGCSGVEFRNDLPGVLFDGDAPEAVAAAARDRGLVIHALAEVKAFNAWSEAKAAEAARLIDIAARCGAAGVALIPRCDGNGLGNGERQANLRIAMRELGPMLAAAGMTGFIEPLGFERSSLRFKAEVVDAITSMDQTGRFQLVHDTFHHHLAGESEIFAAHTGMVHVSGVVDPAVGVAEMTDAHRVHVDARDRLGNTDQLNALMAAGYAGPVSVECFAPMVHASPDPAADLARSFLFIRSALSAAVA